MKNIIIIQEIKKKFFQEIKSRDIELHSAFQQVLTLHNNHGVVIGSFVIVVGSTLEDISKAYDIIDENVRYETSFCASAVELCIKCIKFVNINYGRISSHVLETLEICFGEFAYTRTCKATAAVVKIIKPKSTQKSH